MLTSTHPTQSQYQWGPPGYETSPAIGTNSYFSNAECTDELHKYPYKSGGPLTIRRSDRSATPSALCDLESGYLRFRGHLFCGSGWSRDFNVLDDAWYSGNMPELASDYSVEAWNKFRPGRPDASLAQFIGELREVPRTLRFKVANFRNKGYHGRDFGSDYLNIQFGWLPIVRDIQKFYRAYHKLDKRIKQLRRDNGRPIRRRGVINVDSYKEIYQEGTAYSHIQPSLTFGFYKSVPSRAKVWEFNRKVWFSGRFRYWIPDIGSPEWERRAKRALFGGNLTPALAWELMPWSWLIDYFTNIGDVLENMSANAAENLTADYAYTMLHSQRRHERVAWGNFRERGGATITHSATEYHSIELKHRVHASPFGFGFTEDDLSTRQLGILSALGLTFT